MVGHTLIIPELGKQRQGRSLRLASQPGLISEFQSNETFVSKKKDGWITDTSQMILMSSWPPHIHVLTTYIWTSTHKYTQKTKAKKTKSTHNMREKVHPFHTQMLVLLFLASNAKHILQCISDTLNTTLNTLWRCFEMCTPDKIKLITCLLEDLQVCSEKQAKPFLHFCSRQYGITRRCTTPKTSCLLQLGGHWSHLPRVSFSPLSPLS